MESREQPSVSAGDRQQELAAAMHAAMLAEMVRLIAHEMSQPLAAVVANASACDRWLRRTPPNHGEADAALARILRDAREASTRLRGIDAMMALPLERRTLPVEALLATAASHTAAARPAGVALSIDNAASGAVVCGDRVHVLQVLVELIANAVEALRNAGRGGQVTLAAKPAGRWVELAVIDDGPGVSAADRERIFDAFFTTRPERRGLGLAVSRSIVERHGGRLWAEANPRGGECLRFTLPVEAP